MTAATIERGGRAGGAVAVPAGALDDLAERGGLPAGRRRPGHPGNLFRANRNIRP